MPGIAAKRAIVVAVVFAIAVIGFKLALTGTPEKVAAEPQAVESLTTAQLAGQRIVTGYVGMTPPRYVLRAARSGRIGGVILFTNNMPTPGHAKRAIDRLQRWAKAGGMPPLLVMIDQEGGIVQRLPQLPPRRSPQQVGRNANPAKLAAAEGRNTGRALKRLGFNVNLAPVVDVPKVKNSFLGNRGYSSSTKVVADAACAFAAGNEQGGVAATFKHFPGLGRAGADTDFNDVTIRAPRSVIERELLPYRQCPDTPSLVMLSSARYPSLGVDRPSSLEKQTYAMLAATGFKGLTITDALETPQYGPSANTARSALRAGVDILLWGQAWKRAMSSRKRLIGDIAAGRVTREQLEAGTQRVIDLKTRLERP